MKKGTKKASALKAAKKKAVKKKAAKNTAGKKAPVKKTKTAKAKKKLAKKTAVVKRSTQKSVSKPTKKGTKKAVTRTAKKQAVRKAAPQRKKPTVAQVELPLGARAAPLPRPIVTPDSPEAVLLSLAQLLLGDEEYHAEVQLAASSPEEYLAQFAEEMQLHGAPSTPPPHLPWIALTEGLRQRDALVRLHEKFEPDDLSFALDTLLKEHADRVDLTGLPGYDDGAAALQMIGDRLLAADLALITLRNNNDRATHAVAVVPADRIAEAQRLAARLGLGTIEHWSTEETVLE